MKIKRFLIFPIILILSLVSSLPIMANSNLPYDTYNYDYWENIVYTPAAYIPGGNISGDKMGVGALNNPQDFCIGEDGLLYIADSGNNRIIVSDTRSENLEVIKIIDQFDNEGKKDSFNNPSGVCITKTNKLYIADTNNKRVVALLEDETLDKLIINPQSERFATDFEFRPLRITADYAERAYVIAQGVFEGIMCFDEKGEFTGYSGTIDVKITPLQKVWRRLSTKAQRARQALYIPTEFTSVANDDDGFIYASNIDGQGQQSVRRLNQKGEDVIRENKKTPLSGDLMFSPIGDYGGASRIVDIAYRGKGIYSCLDSIRGRIFTYDHEGNLLYIFGGIGSQVGTFKRPVALESIGDKILVLDSQRGEMLIFLASQYGSLINEAVSLRYDGDESKAVELWEKVFKLDSNFELAYIGIGKSYLSAGDNKQAMKYLKLGMDREYYSIAFKRYRNQWLKQNLGYILTASLLLIIFSRLLKYIRKQRKGRKIHE